MVFLSASAGQAAYFTDGRDREAIPELRDRVARDPSGASDLDLAILRAANRVGWVQWNKCRHGGNGVLVRIDGRDAVLTSAHQVFNARGRGDLINCQGQGAAVARFYPNASYIDLGRTFRNRALEARFSVGLRAELDASGANKSGFFGVADDFLVMFLETDISDDTAPDGQIRGAVPFADLVTGHGFDGLILGFDPRFDKAHGGQAMSYQSCLFSVLTPLRLDHSCDATKGSSSSLLAVFQKGELRLRALNTAVRLPVGTTARPDALPTNWNIGTPIEVMLRHWHFRGLTVD